jgi:hypothetical protein
MGRCVVDERAGPLFIKRKVLLRHPSGQLGIAPGRHQGGYVGRRPGPKAEASQQDRRIGEVQR